MMNYFICAVLFVLVRDIDCKESRLIAKENREKFIINLQNFMRNLTKHKYTDSSRAISLGRIRAPLAEGNYHPVSESSESSHSTSQATTRLSSKKRFKEILKNIKKLVKNVKLSSAKNKPFQSFIRYSTIVPSKRNTTKFLSDKRFKDVLKKLRGILRNQPQLPENPLSRTNKLLTVKPLHLSRRKNLFQSGRRSEERSNIIKPIQDHGDISEGRDSNARYSFALARFKFLEALEKAQDEKMNKLNKLEKEFSVILPETAGANNSVEQPLPTYSLKSLPNEENGIALDKIAFPEGRPSKKKSVNEKTAQNGIATSRKEISRYETSTHKKQKVLEAPLLHDANSEAAPEKTTSTRLREKITPWVYANSPLATLLPRKSANETRHVEAVKHKLEHFRKVKQAFNSLVLQYLNTNRHRNISKGLARLRSLRKEILSSLLGTKGKPAVHQNINYGNNDENNLNKLPENMLSFQKNKQNIQQNLNQNTTIHSKTFPGLYGNPEHQQHTISYINHEDPNRSKKVPNLKYSSRSTHRVQDQILKDGFSTPSSNKIMLGRHQSVSNLIMGKKFPHRSHSLTNRVSENFQQNKGKPPMIRAGKSGTMSEYKPTVNVTASSHLFQHTIASSLPGVIGKELQGFPKFEHGVSHLVPNMNRRIGSNQSPHFGGFSYNEHPEANESRLGKDLEQHAYPNATFPNSLYNFQKVALGRKSEDKILQNGGPQMYVSQGPKVSMNSQEVSAEPFMANNYKPKSDETKLHLETSLYSNHQNHTSTESAAITNIQEKMNNQNEPMQTLSGPKKIAGSAPSPIMSNKLELGNETGTSDTNSPWLQNSKSFQNVTSDSKITTALQKVQSVFLKKVKEILSEHKDDNVSKGNLDIQSHSQTKSGDKSGENVINSSAYVMDESPQSPTHEPTNSDSHENNAVVPTTPPNPVVPVSTGNVASSLMQPPNLGSNALVGQTLPQPSPVNNLALQAPPLGDQLSYAQQQEAHQEEQIASEQDKAFQTIENNAQPSFNNQNLQYQTPQSYPGPNQVAQVRHYPLPNPGFRPPNVDDLDEYRGGMERYQLSHNLGLDDARDEIEDDIPRRNDDEDEDDEEDDTNDLDDDKRKSNIRKPHKYKHKNLRGFLSTKHSKKSIHSNVPHLDPNRQRRRQSTSSTGKI